MLVADGYAGFNGLYEAGRVGGGLTEAGCWAHVRRKIFDVHAATGSALAAEALERIGALYGVERDLHGKPPDARTRERQTRSKPLAEALKAFAETSLAQVPGRSDLAKALRYMLARWPALMRAFDDGRLALDNKRGRAGAALCGGRAQELPVRGIRAGRERAAAFYTLIETAKMNGLDPRVTCATCSRASPITRPSDWPICCLGTGCRQAGASKPPDKLLRHRALTGMGARRRRSLLMDYVFYLWHVLTHKVPLLWRLHLVHHVDLDLDASTALRFHALDMVVSAPWRAGQVALIGLSLGACACGSASSSSRSSSTTRTSACRKA